MHRSHFNTIEFHQKRLKLRTLIMAETTWLRGFCLESLGDGVRLFLRPAKIQWNCNIFLLSSHHCELDHIADTAQCVFFSAASGGVKGTTYPPPIL